MLKRSRFVLGEEVARFEEEWATYCRRRYCVGVGSGLDALILLLRAYAIGPGDEVLVASNTFIGTWMAVSSVGAIPVPVEPDGSMTMSPHLAQEAVTEKTAAILTTHLYGNRSDMDELTKTARFYSVPLLVDACQAHGIVGADLGDGAAFSFYPTKNLGCMGDGGAVVTDNPDVVSALRDFRNYGGQQKDEHARLGVNSRLDELQAAILSAKLPYLDYWNAARRRNAETYATVLGMRLPLTVSHIFAMFSTRRDELREMLAAAGIATMIHYPHAPHEQPCYKGGYPKQLVAARLSRELLSLPVGPELTPAQVEFVAATVASASVSLAAEAA